METGMEISQKIQNGFTIWTQQFQLWLFKANENTNSKRYMKLWYIYTMEYYSAIKKNSFESILMRWMKLEPIIEWSKPER